MLKAIIETKEKIDISDIFEEYKQNLILKLSELGSYYMNSLITYSTKDNNVSFVEYNQGLINECSKKLANIEFLIFENKTSKPNIDKLEEQLENFQKILIQ